MTPTTRRLTALAILAVMLVALPGGGAGESATGAMCSELLINGDFEAGSAGWTQTSTGGFDLISQFNPRDGAWGAYLAGYNDADDWLRQSVSLPAGASSATLRLWWSLETEELALPNDRLALSLLRPDGTALAELWAVDNSAPAGLWDEAVIDLTGYGGQQVTLQLLATTNSYDLSDFYADDLSLIVCTDSNATQRSFLPLIVRS